LIAGVKLFTHLINMLQSEYFVLEKETFQVKVVLIDHESEKRAKNSNRTKKGVYTAFKNDSEAFAPLIKNFLNV